MKKFLFSVLGLLILSCSSASDRVRVSVLNLVSDEVAIDLYIAGKKVVSNLAFEGDSDYFRIDAGGADMTIHQTGQADSIGEVEIVPSGTGDSRILVYGAVASGVLSQIYEQDNSALPEGQGRIRVLNLSDVAFDVHVPLTLSTPLDNVATRVRENVTVGSVTSKIDTGEGDYRVAATDLNSPGSVLYDINPVSLLAGESKTFVAIAGNEPNFLILND